MMLSTQFPELFREEVYAVNLALHDNAELENQFENVLSTKPISGIWTKEYSVVPIGELGGRNEAENIPLKNMSMGYTTYGAQAIEGTGKVNLSKRFQQRSREFSTPQGTVDEPRFAGHIADTVGRGFELRWNQRRHDLTSKLFNLGGIQAGHAFFNQRTRAGGLSDVPNSNLIYDGVALFSGPANPHPSFAAGGTIGNRAAAVGTSVDMAGAVADTGGYFNAFQLPPSYWALKRVITHFINNMQYDEQDEIYHDVPDTLLVSSHNIAKWMEILQSKFIEPKAAGSTTNIESVFMMDAMVEGYRLRVVASPYLIKNTWFIGKANSSGVCLLEPEEKEDPWAYYRDEDNRSYYISYEKEWGFHIRNWRCWCAGSYSTDGTTIPTFNNVAEDNWETTPAGV